MTQDEIIEMARQARLMSEYDETSPWVEGHEITEYVTAFAKLVEERTAAKEREACAKICDDWANSLSGEPEMVEIAAEIRARGQA